MFRKSKINIYPAVFLSPYIIGVLAFSILPILFTLVISFTKWNGFGEMEFVDFQNYFRLFSQDTRFVKSLYNTLLIMVLSIPLTLVIGLLVAYILNRSLVGLKRFFQVSIFAPYITTPIAIGIMFALLFDGRYGFINQLIIHLGIIEKGINWFGEPNFARIALAIVLIWKYSGYTAILLMAGMSMISDDIYEAAKIDGANNLKILVKITLPLLKNIMVFVIITSIIGGLQLFEEPFILFKSGFSGNMQYGGPDAACLTMSMFFYDEAFTNMHLGYGAAVAYAMFAVIAILTFFSMKVRGKGKKNA